MAFDGRMTEFGPGHWCDKWNDVFVTERRRDFSLSERGPGNSYIFHGTYKTLIGAMKAAAKLPSFRPVD